MSNTGSKIDVRLYASVKDLLGKERIEVGWSDNMTAGDLRKKLNELFPILTQVNTQFTIAVNRKAVDEKKLVLMTDELAILPPISGG